MAVDAKLSVVGEVGAELEEERAKVVVDAIEVIMIDHGHGSHDPGILLTRLEIATLLGAKYGCLLLGLAHHNDPVSPDEARSVLLGDVVFTLALGKGDQGDLFPSDEAVDRGNEGFAYGIHEGVAVHSLG